MLFSMLVISANAAEIYEAESGATVDEAEVGADVDVTDVGFTIRTTAPVSGGAGWEYYSAPKNYFSVSPLNGGNCTWYAFGRAYEVTGKNPGFDQIEGDANAWYGWASSHGYTVSQTPRAGSIICWGGKYGHVAFVEKVSGSSVTFTESNYQSESSNPYPRWRSYTTDHPSTYTGSFQGYIYLNISESHTCNHDVYKYFWAAHPHYNVYACSICGKEWVDYNSKRYYDKCSDCNHTVSFNANGGTGAPASQTKKYLSTLYLSNTKPTRKNYEFLGWSTNQYATSGQYQPGSAYNTDANLTLYAIWKLKSYTIKYELSGGDGLIDVMNEGSCPIGKDFCLPSSSPWKTYHVFCGWSLTSNHDYDNCYLAEETIPSHAITEAVDTNNTVTIYAVWKAPEPLEEGDNSISISRNEVRKKTFEFSPLNSGYYVLSCDIDNKNGCFGELYDTGNGHGQYSSYKQMYYFESGKTYYFYADRYGVDDEIEDVNYSINIVCTDIGSFTAKATVFQRKKSSGYYYDAKSFNPIVTIYNTNHQEIFSGNTDQLHEKCGLGLSSSLFEMNDFIIGEQTIPVYLYSGNGGSSFNNLTYDMKVTIIDEKFITGINATSQKNITLYSGYNSNDEYLLVRKAMEDVTLTINYNDGSSENVTLSDCIYDKSIYALYKYQGFEIDFDYEDLKLGDNEISVTYRGFTTSVNLKIVESPVEKISVVSTPTVNDNEYFYIDEFNQKYDLYYYCGCDLKSLLNDHRIKLKVYYKDGSSKLVTINSYDALQSKYNGVNAAAQLGDYKHFFTYSNHISDWGNPDADNYITIEYLGTTVDVYFNIEATDAGLDKAIDYEVIDIPNFDPDHYTYLPNLDGAKLEIEFESGTKKEVILEVDHANVYGEFRLDNNLYRYKLSGDSSTGVSIELIGQKKTIAEACPNTISSIEVLSMSDNYQYLKNALLNITYSDGKVVYTKRYDDLLNFYGLTDQGSWIKLKPKTMGNCDCVIEEMDSHTVLTFENIDEYRAKSLAYNIGRNCDIRDGYRWDEKTEEDIDSLVQSLPFFFSSEINGKGLTYDLAYPYLNKYFGMTKYEIYASSYYNRNYNYLYVTENNDSYIEAWPSAENNYKYFLFDEHITLYSESTDSYIFKYTDENKTQYIEVSKGLKLLSVSGTPPEKATEYSVNMTDGLSSRNKSVEGASVTICINVPEGKEFVKWTSDKAVQFADEKSTETTFTMIDSDITITPVFKDISTEEAFILGDADGDGEITSLDVTQIMRKCARINTGIDEAVLMNGDVDGNGILEITDATWIQRHLAKMETPYAIGETKG